MKPIVYLYQDQLQQLLDTNVKVMNGVAFEWKGENVYHAYTQYPQISPSGSPSISMFRVLDTKVILDKVYKAAVGKIPKFNTQFHEIKLISDSSIPILEKMAQVHTLATG